MTAPRRVLIESPLSGDYTRNIHYADACMLHALEHDEAPMLGHLLYPRVLDDALPDDRARGIAAHLAWMPIVELVAVYCDLGISDGMHLAIQRAGLMLLPVEYRHLGAHWRDWAARSIRPTVR